MPAKSKSTKISASKSDVTISVILDRSGSMAPVRDATIEGFNGFLAEQAKLPGARFSLTQFDSESIDHLYVDVPVEKIKPLDHSSYTPRGGTPLYDAIGSGIARLEAARPKGKVVFVILTDGFNNASKEYTREDVFELVNKKQVHDSWEFVFMGAGVDAYAAGASIGVRANSTYGYAATSAEQSRAFAQVSHSTMMYRTGHTENVAMSEPAEPSKR